MPEPKALPELPRLDANVRVTGTDREKLVRQVVRHYKGGTTCREIAERLGRSYGFVHALLEEGGVNMRSRGGAQTRGTGARTPAAVQPAVAAAQVAGTPPLPVSPARKRAAEHAAAKAAAAAPAKVDVPGTKTAAATAARAAKRAAAARA